MRRYIFFLSFAKAILNCLGIKTYKQLINTTKRDPIVLIDAICLAELWI